MGIPSPRAELPEDVARTQIVADVFDGMAEAACVTLQYYQKSHDNSHISLKNLEASECSPL